IRRGKPPLISSTSTTVSDNPPAITNHGFRGMLIKHAEPTTTKTKAINVATTRVLIQNPLEIFIVV
ncbi:MAG: hypothetical protein KUG73_08380, partial [Pseudomonadales bacterium]|nr:hypothetical protein [Pseudomonadales bacterium]